MTSNSCETPQTSILNSENPQYMYMLPRWEKFRYTMEGGDEYIDRFLCKFSMRESDPQFETRKKITPVPAFATAALTDVKNAIFQRMADIKRTGGSKSYRSVMLGEFGGVDLQGATMNHYIGTEVLNELIFIGKVGVYVDMPELQGQTKADQDAVHPYLYMYRAEQIKNWVYSPNQEGKEFDKLLLEDVCDDYDFFGLPGLETKRYRLFEKQDGFVTVKLYNNAGIQVDVDGEVTTEPIILNVPKIPFVLFELERPLLQDIANHQIALLNLESSDIAYSLRANFPFYIEQRSLMNSGHLKGNEDSSTDDDKEIQVGSVSGRSYGKDMDAPSFINPSSEPLAISMEKQKNLKDDIRVLVNLSVSAIRPKFASAESKEMDEKGLESGLSFLGLVLAQGERQLAAAYDKYEGTGDIATIHYPDRYSLKTDMQRLNEATSYVERMPSLPSKKYQKVLATEVAVMLLESKVSPEVLEEIQAEIEAANWLTGSAEEIHGDIEKGLVDLKTAAQARGYKPENVAIAEEEHARRLARIQAAQSAEVPSQARGNPDGVEDSDEEKKESQDPEKDEDARRRVRGEGAK